MTSSSPDSSAVRPISCRYMRTGSLVTVGSPQSSITSSRGLRASRSTSCSSFMSRSMAGTFPSSVPSGSTSGRPSGPSATRTSTDRRLRLPVSIFGSSSRSARPAAVGRRPLRPSAARSCLHVPALIFGRAPCDDATGCAAPAFGVAWHCFPFSGLSPRQSACAEPDSGHRAIVQ